MSGFFSADTDDLDAFTRRSFSGAGALADGYNALVAQRSALAGLPLSFFVEDSGLAGVAELIRFVEENGRYTADMSSALKQHGDHIGSGRYHGRVSLIDTELARTDADRLDRFEQRLIDDGITPAEATKIREEVKRQLGTDPSRSFHDAALAGLAEYSGISVEEADRAGRAYEFYPTEVASIIDEHFDAIAGQTGGADQITLDDLRGTIADESLPDDVRDVAYRLASDAPLFTDMDVTKQTDLSEEPLGNGFAWDEADGIIGRDDVDQYPDKEYQRRVLSAWHPLVETANEGYDLDKADSHAGQDDVIAFIGDEDIPPYVRLAVFDVYAKRHQLSLERREVLESELAWDGANYGGGTVQLGASGRPPVGLNPAAPPRVASGGRPGGSGGSGASVVAAIVAQLLVVGTEAGIDEYKRGRIEDAGEPAFAHIDPLTGRRTDYDPAELDGLTPAEVKAWVAHFAVTGRPPPSNTETIEPHPYLDPDGQWRISDSNQPIHNVDDTGEPTELVVAPPPGVTINANGEWVYEADGELYDGYELSPSKREPQFEWDNPSGRSRGGYSTKTFGHTFDQHGRHKTVAQLQDRAAMRRNKQDGQFLDEVAAAAFLAEHYDPTKTVAYDLAIPPGLSARVVYADGTIATPTHVRIVPHPNPDHAIRTAYPIVQE